MFNKSPFSLPSPSKNLAVYDTMWKNNVQPDRPQMPIRSMRIACSTPKATNAHSIHVILITFPLKQWLHERPHCCLYRWTACLVGFCRGVDEVPVFLGCDTCVTRSLVPDVSRQPLLRCLEKSGTKYPATQRHTPEKLTHQDNCLPLPSMAREVMIIICLNKASLSSICYRV